MRTATPAAHLSKSLFCITLIYALVLSLFSPLTLSRTEASSAPAESVGKSSPASKTVKKRSARRDGELLVRFRANVSLKDKQAVVASLGGQGAGRLLGTSFAYKISIANGQDPESVAAQLRLNPAVEIAEPNYLVSADQISPSDPYAYAQWALKGTLTGNERANFTGINGLPGRQPATAQQSTVIAVIDSGIDFMHPDLRDSQWKNMAESANGQDDERNDYADDLYGWDWVTKSNEVKDELGHGTRVAGIIAAQGSNAAAISGTEWRLSLMSLRVLDATGMGDVASAVEAIDYAAAHGAKVINCSWGTNENSAILREAIERAGRRNVLVVASAGNDGRDIEQSPYYPASYGLSNVLAVAATDGNDNLLRTSNTGAAHVHVAALGENVLSTGMRGSYEQLTGTSASAALASAFAGLVKTLRPGLSAEHTREMIIAGGRAVAGLSGKVSSGRVIDVAGAVAQVNALPSDEGKDGIDAGNDNRQGAGNSTGNSAGAAPLIDNGSSVEAPAMTKGAPGQNLPNLNLMRNQKPENPKAPPAIPSTRCSHHDPQCDKGQATISKPVTLEAPAPEEEKQQRASSEIVPENLLAGNFIVPTITALFNKNDRIGSDSEQPFLLNLYKSLFRETAPIFERSSSSYSSLAFNAPAPAPPPPSVENVIWTNALGVSVSGNNLTKTAGDSWYNAGAASTQSIASGDGYAEFTTTETTKYRMFGLNNVDTSPGYEDIDFAFYPGGDGYMYLYQSGTYMGLIGTYSAGDRFRVAVESGVVKYYEVTGGTPVLLYTSAVAPTYPLLVDTSLYTSGATITNAVIATGSSAANSFAAERLQARNRTGQSGEDLLSRNYNWSVPLIGLAGRAGLDLGLALSYNSLVWTKSGTTIAFDADHGFPSPGFRLGFPTIQNKFANAQGGSSYLMITASGSRVELRQVGSSTTYEAADSSYIQLTEVPSSPNLLVKTTDGTQLLYEPKGSDYQCTQIKDRNGNYISATYSSSGRITNVTDTLGRVITFNYDAYQNLISITQSWRRDSPSGPVNETHTWATFGWSNLTIQTSFSGLTLSGVSNGQTIPVLTQVGLADGSRYNFEYTAWGQVKTIRNYGVTNVQLNYVTYNMDTSAGQTDCPRFTERRDYAFEWNNNAEVVTTFSAFNPGSGEASVTMPDGTIYKELFYTANWWHNGLTYQSEVWSGGVRKKWTTVGWTQDNTSLTYQLNPRPNDISIYDEAGNRRRTSMEYTSYGLPTEVYEYAADAWTILRRTHIDYNLSTVYTDRRIIGLVSGRYVYSGTSTLVSKVNYHYDWGNPYMVNQGTAVQHDSVNYGAGFTLRGNLVSVQRWDVRYPTDQSLAVEFRTGYNTTGSPIFTGDPLWHRTDISYTDSFSDSINRNTFAYPTTVTDPDSYSSYLQYNYDMGVPTRTQDPKGAVQTIAYDAAGRKERVTNQTSGAYTRWVYSWNTQVQQFQTIQSGVGEAHTFTITDGAGRVRSQGADLPQSAGGYRGQFFLYDVMGRLNQQSNPTEINGTWVPTGDDAAGWVWSYQQYDWQGRPTITTNADGTTTQVSYNGCGCAGGEVITLTGETLTNQGNRRQKIYKDVLGRTVKTEALNWDGTVYSSIVNSYNARDQVTNIRQYAGAEGSGTYQDTVMTYDGFGRLATRKVPAQLNPTTYSYYADDTVQTIQDARGATQHFTYNNRHLVTGITYGAPSGIAGTAAVSYTYDQAGNRLSMTDGTGSTSYQYNTLSQLTQETRTITGAGSFALNYSYNLAGQLTSITDPFSAAISYSYDYMGRMTGITGTSFGGVTQYANNIQYRAWGALKHLNYGNNPLSLDITYNSRLQVNRYTVAGVLDRQYQYYQDGRLKFAEDKLVVDSRFDRSYSYDHLGRITQALSGLEARGWQSADGKDRPYNESFAYDAMNHLTIRNTLFWDRSFGSSDTYTNDRRPGWSYDADGRILGNPYASYIYDAAGQIITVSVENSTTQSFDGDGQRVKSVEETFNEQTWQYQYETKYYIRSSILGGRVLSELNAQGGKLRTYVYAGGSVFGWQEISGGTQYVMWEHRDANNTALRVTDANGQGAIGREMDPLGADAGTFAPFNWNLPDKESLLPYPAKYDPTSTGVTYNVDGIPMPAEYAIMLVNNGNAVPCPNNNCVNYYFYNDGRAGYLFEGERYVGRGFVEGEDGMYPRFDFVLFSANSIAIDIDDLGQNDSKKSGSPPNPALVRKYLSECINELWGGKVKLTGFDPSRKGYDGWASFEYGSGKYARIKNDATTFSMYAIDYLRKNLKARGKHTGPLEQTAVGVTFAEANVYNELEGMMMHVDPYTNYTANDADKALNVVSGLSKLLGGGNTGIGIFPSIQIHELGNSIAYITGWDIGDKTASNPGDTDSGIQLEGCVWLKFGAP